IVKGAYSGMLRAGFLPAWTASKNAVRSGQRKPSDHGGLERKGAKVLGLEVVHAALAARTRQDLDLRCQSVEEVRDSLRACVDLQPGGERWILGGDANRATARMAMVAIARLGADLVVIVQINRLIAVERYQEGGAEIARVGSQGHCLGAVGPVT